MKSLRPLLSSVLVVTFFCFWGKSAQDDSQNLPALHPWQLVHIKAGAEWLSISELEGKARDYLKQRNTGFDGVGVETNIWIEPSGSNCIAKVVYSSGIAKPLWQIIIGPDGKVVDCFTGIARERVRSFDSEKPKR
jgi:hypothetical protein